MVACKPEPETVKGSGTVLLVDDEEVIVEVASGMLKLLNYTVLTARSGSEALSLFTEQRERIDLVILDMIIPDMDGAQIFHRLKGIAPEVKVLLASGYSLKGQSGGPAGKRVQRIYPEAFQPSGALPETRSHPGCAVTGCGRPCIAQCFLKTGVSGLPSTKARRAGGWDYSLRIPPDRPCGL